MSDIIFGLDFGTTNSLAAVVVAGEVRSLADEVDGRPFPSVVWYRGGEVVVGREARRHMETSQGGVSQGFVRSPKIMLRRPGAVHIEGRVVDPIDIVAHVLQHLKKSISHRQGRAFEMSRAVMTIPVDFAGAQRRSLREAARKAGIGVLQFVHEPAAALYAYIRGKREFQRELTALENKIVLVFDWGGGTLDLTVCRILDGVIMQVVNRGNNEIGGDRFDERLRNLVRDRHAKQHGLSDISALEHPGVAAPLLTQCELAKIGLSSKKKFTVIVKDYLKAAGSGRNLSVDLDRSDLDASSDDLVGAGLQEIDQLLEGAHLDRRDVELCVATGGMVNMPAIWHGLVERFGTRVPPLANRESIIAEGAAWIAEDGLRLMLAKPIEILVANGAGRGTYLSLVNSGFTLPVENQTTATENRRFYCVDPRDGTAVFEFAKPRKVGIVQATDDRITLGTVNLPVDPTARPFIERLECKVQIDENYIAHISVHSKLRDEIAKVEFHDLDFGLSLPASGSRPGKLRSDGRSTQENRRGQLNAKDGITPTKHSTGVVSLRSNVADSEDWTFVPGDIVKQMIPSFHFWEQSSFQSEEEMYYRECSYCSRTIFEINTHGAVEKCKQHNCGV